MKRLRRILREFVREMPLGGLDSDYVEYWRKREEEAGGGGGEGGTRPFHRNIIAAALIPQENSVLDVGCGPGKLLELLRERRPDLILSGNDISSRAVELAKAKGLDVWQQDLLKKPLKRDYDTICVMTVLEHVQDAEDLVRALTPCCLEQMLIAIPNLGFIGHRIRLALFGRMPLTSVWFDIREHVRFWTVADFRYWSMKMGLEITGIHATHSSWIRRKWPSLLASQIVYDLKPTN